MPAPEAGAPDRGQAGCGRRRLREALPALGAELRRPSKSSPGSAVVRAPRPHLPSTVSGPTTDRARFPKGKAVRPSRPFPEHLLRVGRVSAPAAVGAVGANQACPAPHTGNLMTVPETLTCSCDVLQQRVPGVGPRPCVSGGAGSPDRLVRGWGAGV